jgi:hypothetical protein
MISDFMRRHLRQPGAKRACPADAVIEPDHSLDCHKISREGRNRGAKPENAKAFVHLTYV